MPRVTAPFDITGWEPAPPDQTAWADAPALGRVTIRKTYTGELAGEGVAEMLTCMADPDDYARGAVYTAMERFVGRLGDREGTFAFQHGAVSGGGPADSDPAGAVAPGSGTGALAGLRGRVAIHRDPGGAHTLVLDYELD
ncbi:MAG TPA: DUF3224 domain-containing protein [Rubricoccaceae bacterium]|jgi:hypothetical protein